MSADDQGSSPISSPSPAATPWWRGAGTQPLLGLLLLGAVLRLIAAAVPGFHHPDAIYQYLEPAQRLLTGDGVITWEWRTGIRSWTLPALLAVPLGLGEWLDPTGTLPGLLPRVATGLASLSIVWAAWQIGRRHAPLTGALAAFVAATWFELIFFGAQTLAEPLATAAFMPAAALVTAPRQRGREIAIAGALLGFVLVARPHYAPTVATLMIAAWWPRRGQGGQWRRTPWLITGGLAVALASATIDAAQGQLPFAWMVENIRENLVHGVAARYGTLPAIAYVSWLLEIWRWWLVAVAIGVRFGWRQCPALAAAALVTLLVHSGIAHKEYRFIFLPVAALLVLAAIGWGDIAGLVGQRWGAAVGRRTAVAVFAAWGLASLALSQGSFAPNQFDPGTAGSRLFAAMRRDPAVCGVALVKEASFAAVPGASGLRPATPLSLFWPGDPASAPEDPWRTAARWGTTYNRLITFSVGPASAPAGYRLMACHPLRDGQLCLFARPGHCTGAAKSPFLINQVLARTGF
jgi:phosphatidylinositol glycan class B